MENENDDDARDMRVDIDEKLRESGQQLAGRLPFLGHVAWLCARSPAHRLLFLQDLDWRIIPPLMIEQFKLYFDKKTSALPVAFVSWAYLSERAERDYIRHQRLAPSSWKSGNRLWLIDFVTPFGGVKNIFNDIYGAVHKNCEVHLLYPGESYNVQPTTLRALVAGKPSRARDDNGPTRH